MPSYLFAAVMAAALLHATWNAIVKSLSDKLLATIMVAAAAAAISGMTLPFLASPARASWGFIALAAVFQIAYLLLVAATYEAADLSQAYPLMRGTAPLLVAVVSAVKQGESLPPVAWIGVIGICVGIVSMSTGSAFHDRKGLSLAMLNAFVIAGYTLVDGSGVRRSGAPAAYALWEFLLCGVPLAAWAAASRRAAFIPFVARHWRLGMAAGIGTTLSYGLALWAMTLAPVAMVAALRETSILFATLIAGLVLKEQIGRRRWLAVCIIAGSSAILRIS